MVKYCRENGLKQLTSSEMTDIFELQISSYKGAKRILEIDQKLNIICTYLLKTV